MTFRRGPTSARLAICLIVPADHAVAGTTPWRAAPPGHAADLPSLAALTPIGHEVALIRDTGGPLDWARLCRRYDVIALTGSHGQRARLLEILGLGRGAATICVAGPIVAEEEAALEALCNVRFVGPIEETWPRFVDDLAAGRHTLRRYRRPEVPWRAWSAAAAVLAARWRRLRAAALA